MSTLSPEFAAATALHRSGRLAEAEQQYRALLGHVSQAAQAHAALGLLFSQQRRFSEARQHYEQVVAREPNDFLACKLLADACAEAGDPAASARYLRQAARCREPAWLWELNAGIVAPLAFESIAAIDAYRQHLAETLAQFEGAAAPVDLDELAASGCKPPLALAYQGRDDRALKEQFARVFANRLPADLPATPIGKPHVGFVVTEGNEGVFIRSMTGILRKLNLQELRISVVCSAKAAAKLRQLVPDGIEFIHQAPRFTQTLAQMRQARFDLLYHWEIGTDCVNYFLPFFRLAAVQCTSWGWPVTSGIPEVDYFLSCVHLEPPDAQAHYTERLVQFRHMPNDYALPQVAPLPPRSARPFADRHVYFCGQNPRKLHPDFDTLLGRILRCDVRGVVLLVEAARPALTAALKRRMERTLPDCVERIHWLPRMTQQQYLEWLAMADCVLDTPHYSGGANSTYDAFAVAAPMVTLCGEFHRGRYTAAACRLLGLDECVAQNASEYARQALQIAADRDYRRQLSRQIIERRHALFNNHAAAAELQEFFLHTIASVR